MTRPVVPRLHLVGPAAGLDGSGYVETAAHAVAGGCTAVHLRMPSADACGILEVARALQKAIDGALLVVNGRVDVALIAGAGGVQLGERGLPVADVRRLAGAGMLIGRSIHDVTGTVRAAADGADFVIAGHVFATASKQGIPARGLAWLEQVVASSPVPVIAIGGITEETAGAVIQAGAYGVAVSSAILGAPSPRRAAERIARQVEQRVLEVDDAGSR